MRQQRDHSSERALRVRRSLCAARRNSPRDRTRREIAPVSAAFFRGPPTFSLAARKTGILHFARSEAPLLSHLEGRGDVRVEASDPLSVPAALPRGSRVPALPAPRYGGGAAHRGCTDWELKAIGQHDLTSCRILVVRTALRLLAGDRDVGLYLGQLSTLLHRDDLECLGNVAPSGTFRTCSRCSASGFPARPRCSWTSSGR